MEEADSFVVIFQMRLAQARTKKWIYVLFSFMAAVLLVFSLWSTRNHLGFIGLIPVGGFWMVFLFRRAVLAAKEIGSLQSLRDKLLSFQGGLEIKRALEVKDE